MAESGEQKLASVKPELWIKGWEVGEIGWHKDFVDVMLQVNGNFVLLASFNQTSILVHSVEVFLFPVWREREPRALGVSSTV